jgi:uncharacterized protein (TIGR03437 family)
LAAAVRWLAPVVLCLPIRGGGPGLQAPSYTPASIVNAATHRPGPLAPGAIATIYGTGLSYTTRALTPEEIVAGELPVALRGSGTRVLVAGRLSALLYVSPTQINFIVSPQIAPGTKKVEVVLDSLRGEAEIEVAAAAPGLFLLDETAVVATRADGSLISSGNPGRPGEIAVLYATGLGITNPLMADRQIPRAAASIAALRDLRVVFDGEPVEPASILYAGLTPGFAGLYQINLRLPAVARPDPEVRVAVGDRLSPPATRLPMTER